MRPQIHHRRHHIKRDTHILETSLIILWIGRLCNLTSIASRIAKKCIDLFCNVRDTMIQCIEKLLELQVIGVTHRCTSNQELLVPFFAAELSSRIDDGSNSWITSSGLMEVIWLGATAGSETVRTFFFVLEIEIRDRDSSIPIATQLELEAPWKRGTNLWWNHFRSVVNLGESWTILGPSFKFSLKWTTCVVGTRGLATTNSIMMDEGTSWNISGRMRFSTL